MTEPRLELLFDEYAVRYVRGEQPDVRDYLERAGAEREELGRMLDRFLETVPAREPTEEDVVLMEARLEQQPPIFLLRLRRALGRDSIVDSLVTRLSLDPAKTDKVEGYYHDLEVGNLDPEPVDRRVWDVLGETLQANVRALVGLRPEPPATSAVAYHRLPTGPQARLTAAARTPAAPTPEEPDEIDRLFLGPEGT